MIPGTYRLTTDVINPKPDRRSKRDWRCLPVIPAGTVFAVSSSIDFQTMHAQGFRSGHYITPSNDLWPLMQSRLEAMPEMPSDYLVRVGWTNCAAETLDVLVEQGKLTLAEVESALEIYLDR